MKRTFHFLHRFLALFLSLLLCLPGPAMALRPLERAQNKSGLEQLSTALGHSSSAGLEERGLHTSPRRGFLKGVVLAVAILGIGFPAQSQAPPAPSSVSDAQAKERKENLKHLLPYRTRKEMAAHKEKVLKLIEKKGGNWVVVTWTDQDVFGKIYEQIRLGSKLEEFENKGTPNHSLIVYVRKDDKQRVIDTIIGGRNKNKEEGKLEYQGYQETGLRDVPLREAAVHYLDLKAYPIPQEFSEFLKEEIGKIGPPLRLRFDTEAVTRGVFLRRAPVSTPEREEGTVTCCSTLNERILRGAGIDIRRYVPEKPGRNPKDKYFFLTPADVGKGYEEWRLKVWDKKSPDEKDQFLEKLKDERNQNGSKSGLEENESPLDQFLAAFAVQLDAKSASGLEEYRVRTGNIIPNVAFDLQKFSQQRILTSAAVSEGTSTVVDLTMPGGTLLVLYVLEQSGTLVILPSRQDLLMAIKTSSGSRISMEQMGLRSIFLDEVGGNFDELVRQILSRVSAGFEELRIITTQPEEFRQALDRRGGLSVSPHIIAVSSIHEIIQILWVNDFARSELEELVERATANWAGLEAYL